MKNITQQYSSRQRMLTNDYEVFYYSDRDLNHVSLHHHDFYECYYFVSGEVTYIIEGKAYHLVPGDIILINTKELHQPIINNHKIPYERLVLWINKAYLVGLCTESADLKRCFEDEDRKNVLKVNLEIQQTLYSTLLKLIDLMNYNGMGKDLLYRAYITEFLITLNNFMFYAKDKMITGIEPNNLTENIIQYINTHLDESILIDDLAEKFYLSKFHLLREFKKQSGTTIHKYILQKRLIHAKELILEGLPIIQVYEQCGFGDYSNFFRAFKNEYGITPKEFYQIMNQQKSDVMKRI